MSHRSLVVALLLALAGCADPTAAVSVKTTTKASSAPVATKPSTEAPPVPVVGGAAGLMTGGNSGTLISPGGATAAGPKLDPTAPGIGTNPTQTLISNDGGGFKGSSTDTGTNQPGAWTAQPAAGASTAPSPSPTPAR
jgi:hypothetical protein